MKVSLRTITKEEEDKNLQKKKKKKPMYRIGQHSDDAADDNDKRGEDVSASDVLAKENCSKHRVCGELGMKERKQKGSTPRKKG